EGGRKIGFAAAFGVYLGHKSCQRHPAGGRDAFQFCKEWLLKGKARPMPANDHRPLADGTHDPPPVSFPLASGFSRRCRSRARLVCSSTIRCRSLSARERPCFWRFSAASCSFSARCLRLRIMRRLTTSPMRQESLLAEGVERNHVGALALLVGSRNFRRRLLCRRILLFGLCFRVCLLVH